MDTMGKALINFILEQSVKEISYEKQLEQQKMLLLAQKEVENWKRLVYETERCREQYLREDRLKLKQVFKQRNLAYRLIEPGLKIVIDQGLERWMNHYDGADNDYQEEINRHKSRIDRMQLQTTRYQDVLEKVKESKSHQMLQESSRKVREEEAKIEQSRKLIENLWKESNEHGKREWNEMKQMIVEFIQSCTDSHIVDLEIEAIMQNNEIKRVKIVQLQKEIEQAKLELEEEARRQEIELNERILIPIKITPMILENSIFKNPNDFPALIDKIESTRKSYEQIFKDSNYMNLRKSKKRKKTSRSKCSTYFDMLFSAKRKAKIRKTPSHSEPEPVISVADELPSIAISTKLDSLCAADDRCTTKSNISKLQPLTTTHEKDTGKPSKASKRKPSNEYTDDQMRPICSAQEQRDRQNSSVSQPELTYMTRDYAKSELQKKRPCLEGPILLTQPELPGITRDNAKSELQKKRSSLDTPILASAPPYLRDHREFKKPQHVQGHSPKKPSSKSKSKKGAFQLEPEQIELECDSLSFSPEKSNHKTIPISKQQSADHSQTKPDSLPPEQIKQQLPKDDTVFEFQGQQQKTVEDDNFSFGSASPPLDSRQSKDDGDCFFDAGSVSSFDMDDREGSSDLGFDLSPVIPRTNTDRNEHREGGGSDGNTSDFDFLSSPPNSATQTGSQTRKGQDCFAFTDDDSEPGFDFF